MIYTSVVAEANGRITLKVASQEVINVPSSLFISTNPNSSMVSLSCTPNPYDEDECIVLDPTKITSVNGTAFSGDKYALFAALKPFFIK